MILTEWAILTEHLDFPTKEMWARIQSDYPVNIWKEYKNDCMTKMTQSRVKMSGKSKQDLDFAAEAKRLTFLNVLYVHFKLFRC